MDEFRETLTTAALLHDIGKVIFRTGRTGSTYNHSVLGAEWARAAGYPDDVVVCILNHHDVQAGYPKGAAADMTALVSGADRIAAGMEREHRPGEGEGGRFDPGAVLKNIMSTVDIGKGPPATSYFGPEPDAFPESSARPKGLGDVWNALATGLKPSLPSETLLLTLEKYISNFPEYTYRVGDDHPSTSLYHHVKSTAAIALADLAYLTEASGLNPGEGSFIDRCAHRWPEEERFLLVLGDVSGIQDFIYGVSSRKALRLLRARSFFVELLCETACSMLIDGLGLPRASVIYSSGGGFAILVANTPATTARIEESARQLNGWLLSSFGPALYLAVAWTPVSAAMLKGGFSDAWSRAHEAVRRAKAAKWKDNLAELVEPVFRGDERCDCCGRMVPSVGSVDDFSACEFCQLMIDLGRQLPATGEVFQVSDAGRPLIEIAGLRYSTSPGAAPRRRIALRCGHEPTDSIPTWRLLSGSRVDEAEILEVAAESIGVSRVGVLRMDVDNLGLIFSRGLKNPTLARVSDLSARFDRFFKAFVPQRLSDCLGEGVFRAAQRKPALSVVYSGGDDLFLLGPWDQVFEAAFWVRQKFTEYCGFNPNITLSAGMLVADERLAIRKLAAAAGEQESRAKASGKNRLCIGGRCVEWGEAGDLVAAAAALVETKGGRAKAKLSRSFLRTVARILDPRDGAWRLPRLYYAARRAKYPEVVAKVLPFVDRPNLLSCALMIADLASRGGSVDAG